jgi:hypothetical protein
MDDEEREGRLKEVVAVHQHLTSVKETISRLNPPVEAFPGWVSQSKNA